MDNHQINEAFSRLSTPLVTDACIRLGLPFHIAPAGIVPLFPGVQVAGRALPVRHFGSVDVFLEAMLMAQPGDVLVIDNQGRMDEGCIGDLTALEVKANDLAAMIVWGCHRDTPECIQIGLPIFSCGAYPVGPLRLDQRSADALDSAQIGDCLVNRDHLVAADDDGVVFLPQKECENILAMAEAIRETERRQADALRAGRTLRDQLRFDQYLERRADDPTYSFRTHLRAIGGAIEE